MPDLPFMPLDARFADVLGLIDTLANEFKGGRLTYS